MGKTIVKELPCSVGEKLYLVSNFFMRGKFDVEEVEVENFCIKKGNKLTIHLKDRNMYYSEDDLGVVLFTSEKEANKAAETWDGKRGV